MGENAEVIRRGDANARVAVIDAEGGVRGRSFQFSVFSFQFSGRGRLKSLILLIKLKRKTGTTKNTKVHENQRVGVGGDSSSG
jgi:hypothetical protein